MPENAEQRMDSVNSTLASLSVDDDSADNSQSITLNSAVSSLPSNFTTGGMVALYVGKQRKKFEVHRNLLIKYSAYCRAALAKDWLEGQTKKVYWDDERLLPVEIMIDWLYQFRDEAESLTVMESIDCYALGHKRGMVRFQNYIVDALRAKLKSTKKSSSLDNLQRLYLLDLQDTPLHDFIVQDAVRHMMRSPALWLDAPDRMDKFSQQLDNIELRTLWLSKMLEWHEKSWKDPRIAVGCYWHDHSDGSVCK